MKATFAIDTPVSSADLVKALQAVLQANGGQSCVSLSPPNAAQTIEHWPSPLIADEETQRIFISIDYPLAELKNKLLDEQLFNALVIAYGQQPPSTDLLAVESIVVSCAAREVTDVYMQSSHRSMAKRVTTQATAAAQKTKWIERCLGTPSVKDLMDGFADGLLARGLPR